MRSLSKALAVGGSSVLVLGTAAALPAAAATTSAKSAGFCTSAGAHRYTITGKHFRWIVAQQDREENYSGEPEKLTFEVGASTTRKNTVAIKASVKVKVSMLWDSFEASVGTDIGSSTASTSFAKTTRSYKLKSGDSYYFGQGTGRWQATAHVFVCSKVDANGDGYAWYEFGAGTLTGYTGVTRAVVGCKQKVSASSFSAALKANC